MDRADPPLDAPSTPPPVPPVLPSTTGMSQPRPGLVLAALVFLLGFIGFQGRLLWREWSILQNDWSGVRLTTVVGYPNISPNPSLARRPDNWFHEEGESTLLWSGWKKGNGHRWFRVGRGEVDRRRISEPFGRDVIQAIDYPMVETEGGAIWRRIPGEAPVFGWELGGIASVCPMQVLDKVEVVNDLILDQPFLIVFSPQRNREHPVRIYEPLVGGQRLTMGLSGYFQDRDPVLYDRGTESLWVTGNEGLLAIAGPRKGTRLRRLAEPARIAWGAWRGSHPKSRLLVGADRSKAPPAL